MTTLTTLPTEILLHIIPQIAYTPSNLAQLSLTTTRFNQILTEHEPSLVRAYLKAQPSLYTSRVFHPGLSISNFADLAILHSRISALTRLRSDWWQLTQRQDVRWLRCSRWARIFRAGLLVLWALQDNGTSHESRQGFMRRLPMTSLGCLFFALVGGMALLRANGPEKLRREHVCHCVLVMDREVHGEDEMKKREMELACEEVMLSTGPEFLFGLIEEGTMEEDGWAVSALDKETANFEERQLPYPDGTPNPMTLIATLRQTLASEAGCRICETKGKMWEVLSATGFDTIDDTMLAALAAGESVDGGGKRMGY